MLVVYGYVYDIAVISASNVSDGTHTWFMCMAHVSDACMCVVPVFGVWLFVWCMCMVYGVYIYN